MRKELQEYLQYEQPTKYIVSSDNYDDTYGTPVLTAGKSFILGYTNEKEGVFPKEKLPVIIFDDFTTSVQLVTMPFKVKSSALKILHSTEGNNIIFLYYLIKNIKFDSSMHKRYWISEFSKIKVKNFSLAEQNIIEKELSNIDNMISNRKEQIVDLNHLIKSKFMDMFKDEDKYPREELKMNVEEMFIGPFGSALKNECFVIEEKSSCVVYEQKHAINKYIGDFRYVDNKKHEELKRFEIHPNDIIVSCRGTVGETYVIPQNAPLGIMHPSIMKIRLNPEKYNPIFFNEVIKQYLSDNLNQTNGGIIKMGIKASDLGKTKFIRPSLEEQNNFLKFIHIVEKQKFECEKDIEDLEKLLEVKMSKYFDGR